MYSEPTVTEHLTNPPRAYASFWSRCHAFVWDYLMIALYLLLIVGLCVIAQLYLPGLLSILYRGPIRSQLASFLLVTMPVSLYFAFSEASSRHATWGKQRRNLQVLRASGKGPTLGRSLLRTTIKFMPWELAHICIWQFTYYPDNPPLAATVGIISVWCFIGANIASLLLSPTRQTIYDRLAGTFVILHTS